jgi:catechol 2,3-dioxygenase
MIHPETKLDYVHLTVADLKKSLPFYQQVLGFQVNRRGKDTVALGAGEQDILLLTENPDAKPLGRAAGLYHFAVLVPSRIELARVLKSIAEHQVPVSGFADHLVSEAIYLPDPDGNGIEMYRDRPRSDWYDASGKLLMGTEPIDLDGLVGELENVSNGWTGLAKGTVLGHMHLKVSNMSTAKKFYTELIGFDMMMSWGSAGFVSAGGYHHHLGFNTWESNGAPSQPRDGIGLQHYVIHLPNSDELHTLTNRIRQAGLELEEIEAGLLIRDPSDNGVVLTTGA